MPALNLENLDPKAKGLRLHKHDAAGNLRACELIIFKNGAAAINTVLRRAAIAGMVKCEPFDESPNFFADVYVDEQTSTQTILLDQKSYSRLKNHWMRCKLEPFQ